MTRNELADWHDARAAELMKKWEAAYAAANDTAAKAFGHERAVHFETAAMLRGRKAA